MIKPIQFIKWCLRKIWASCSRFVLATPIALYTFYKYVKGQLREETVITLCLWALATLGVMCVVFVSSFVYSSIHNNYDIPMGHFMKIVLFISGILLSFVGIHAIYNVFEDEQKDLLCRLKK